VRYVYETGGSDAEAQEDRQNVNLADLRMAMSALPASVRAQLTEATELGDMELIDQRIVEIQGHNPALAKTLARLARNFEYDKLLSLIQGVTE
jgi:hypothetical protein